jgi:phosphatidylserine/phosphatidylglycerophosphate/cardiolipin synthase-like enzyme
MSTNLISKDEWEVYLKYTDKEKIKEFESKFDKIKDLFINEYNLDGRTIPGNFYSQLAEENQQEVLDFYTDVNRLNVKQYSPKTAPKQKITSGLKISPFEGRARDYLGEMVNTADKFIYLLSERLFDDKVVEILGQKILNEEISLKILTGPPEEVRQDVKKARDHFRKIAIYGGEIYALEDFHAKCWITDKWLMIGSANLTKMNLGIKKTGNYWRANTEIIYFEDDKNIINEAKKQVDELCKEASSVMQILGTSNKAKDISKQYFDLFDHYSKDEAKEMFAKIRLKFRLKREKDFVVIARYAAKLAKKFDQRYITKINVIMATILSFLRERNNTFDNLYDRLKDIVEKRDFEESLNILNANKLIEKNRDLYEINLDTLLK